MSHYTVKLKELPVRVATRLGQIEQRVSKALMATASDAVPMIRRRAPKAFGPLQESVHEILLFNQTRLSGMNSGPQTHAKTVVAAPYGADVERGSPPHKPNFERLLAWVKLRGMQGLSKGGRKIRRRDQFKPSEGVTTPGHARGVAIRLKALEIRGRGKSKKNPYGVGRSSPTDAAVQVTKNISAAIEKNGTRPQWFVRNSIIEIAATMGRRVRSAVKS